MMPLGGYRGANFVNFIVL